MRYYTTLVLNDKIFEFWSRPHIPLTFSGIQFKCSLKAICSQNVTHKFIFLIPIKILSSNKGKTVDISFQLENVYESH